MMMMMMMMVAVMMMIIVRRYGLMDKVVLSCPVHMCVHVFMCSCVHVFMCSCFRVYRSIESSELYEFGGWVILASELLFVICPLSFVVQVNWWNEMNGSRVE